MRTAAVALFVAWYAYEIYVSTTRRAALSGARRVEILSLRLIVVSIAAGVVLAVFAARLGIGVFPGDPPAVTAAGLALLAGGVAFRVAAIRTLGKLFTVDVSVAGDHALVAHGPYRLVRHPSYLGALVGFLGFGLALGSWVSAALLVAVMLPAYVYRIRVEESALREALGRAYAEYASKTARLIPGIY